MKKWTNGRDGEKDDEFPVWISSDYESNTYRAQLPLACMKKV